MSAHPVRDRRPWMKGDNMKEGVASKRCYLYRQLKVYNMLLSPESLTYDFVPSSSIFWDSR